MSPADIKATRVRLGLTQELMAEALGVAKLTMSQYETGFRKPGPTALILLMVVDSLSKKKALELIELFRRAAQRFGPERKDSKT
jgi:DNA-binding transcriptional regulator YiaG